MMLRDSYLKDNQLFFFARIIYLVKMYHSSRKAGEKYVFQLKVNASRVLFIKLDNKKVMRGLKLTASSSRALKVLRSGVGCKNDIETVV